MNEIVDREVFLFDFGRHVDACHKEFAGILIHHTIINVESLQKHHGCRLDTQRVTLLLAKCQNTLLIIPQ